MTLQIYRQIVKKNKKGNNSVKTIFFKKREKMFWIITWGMLCESFEAAGWLQSKTHTHISTYIQTSCRTSVIKKKSPMIDSQEDKIRLRTDITWEGFVVFNTISYSTSSFVCKQLDININISAFCAVIYLIYLKNIEFWSKIFNFSGQCRYCCLNDTKI